MFSKEILENVITKKMADDENSIIILTKNSVWMFLGTIGDAIGDAKTKRYLSLCGDTIYIYKIKDFFKYNGIDEETIQTFKIKDIKSFTINNKIEYTEKKLKKQTCYLKILHKEEKIKYRLQTTSKSASNAVYLLKKINSLIGK